MSNLNQAGKKFWESLSRGVDTRVGTGKNEGYPRLKEHCLKEAVEEPSLVGEQQADGSG